MVRSDTMVLYGEIAVIDQSGHTGWDTAAGKTVCAALARQLREHVQPAYRIVASPVNWYTDPKQVPAKAWPIYLLDTPDVADALGYHDVDPQGKPYGRVFVKPTKQAGAPLSSVLSHEVVEALVDPDANLWSDAPTGVSVAFEACDPVEDSGYQIDGVDVSNFVTRAWFDVANRSGPYDYLHHLSKPRTLEKGGYQILMHDGKVTQQMGMFYPEWRLALKRSPQPSRTVWREVRELLG
jgi:hypothetical protein